MKVLWREHHQHQPRRTGNDDDFEKRRRQRPTLERRRSFRKNHRRVTFGKSGNEKVPRKQNGERTHSGGEREPDEEMPSLENKIRRPVPSRKSRTRRFCVTFKRRTRVFGVLRPVRGRRIRSRAAVRAPIPHRMRRSMVSE